MRLSLSSIWMMAFTLSQTLSLHELEEKHSRRRFLRVLLRTCSPSIQRRLLTGDIDTEAWIQFVM